LSFIISQCVLLLYLDEKYQLFIFYLCSAKKVCCMFVLPLVGEEVPNVIVAGLTARSGQQTQQSRNGSKTKKGETGTKKTTAKPVLTKNHPKKELPQKKTYSEEPVVKDAFWNIYSGNPGYYTTDGDTINFGTVTSLSDSAFFETQRDVAPKLVKPYGFVGKQRVSPGQDWILGVILILWMIFASVRAIFPKYMSQIFVSIIDFGAATRLFRQRGYKTIFGAVRLDVIFHLILPLSAFQIAVYNKMGMEGFHPVFLYLGLLLISNGFLFIKILLYRLVGSIAMLKEETDELIFNIRLYYKVLGLILLPFVTIHAIHPETNFITVVVMAGLMLMMYIATIMRSIYLGHQKDISIFYLILYLCTLEILPLLLIFKLISAS
jgi:hypothetical protein